VVRRYGALVLILATAPLAAQEGRVWQSMAAATEPVGPAGGWALASAGTRTPVSAALTAQGAATRMAPATDLTVFHAEWTARGRFTVSAFFERLSSASSRAPYGLTVGTTDEARLALALLIAPDGTLTVQRGAMREGRTRLAGQVPPRVRSPLQPDGPAVPLDRLEEAELVVNGQTVARVPIAPGELDGHAGVHVGGGGQVLVSGFTLTGAVTAVTR
jgi:hypothetical protein